MRHRALLGSLIALLAMASSAGAQVTIEQGGLWRLEGRVSVTACVSGRCASDRAHVERDVDIPSGATVDVGLSVGTCSLGPEDLDGLITSTPTPRGVLKVRVADRRRLNAILRECSGYASFHLVSAGGRIALAEDGLSFDSTLRVAFSVRVKGRSVAVTTTAKLHGMRLEDDSVGFTNRAAADSAVSMPEVADLLSAVIDRLE